MASEHLVIVDAGPLIAFFDRNDPQHKWVKSTADSLSPPFVTSESVLSETCFLLERSKLPCTPLFDMIEEGSIAIGLDLQVEHPRIRSLMASYADQPMSLADATLVRLAELHDGARVFTLDKHFRIYRRNSRQMIPLIIPDGVR